MISSLKPESAGGTADQRPIRKSVPYRAPSNGSGSHTTYSREVSGLLRGSWTAYSRVVPRLAHVLLRKDVGFRSQHSAVKILFPLDFTKQGLLNRSGIKASRAKGACHEPAEIMRERLPFPTHAYRWIPMPSRPK
jgi:hypothetical protein